MRDFVRARLLTTLLTVWATVTLAFFALRLLPGDAIAGQLLQSGASEADIAAQRAALHLDEPPLLQYGRYMAGLLRGDLGTAILSRQPVSLLVSEQLGATAALALSALAFAVVVGLSLGMVEALAWPRWPGQVANILSILALSAPIYWTGTLAIMFFSVTLGVLPATGSSDLRHLLLPAGVLGFHVAGSIARITVSSLRETLAANFTRVAQAKGLTRARILRRHILRPSLPAILTVIALQTGFLLGGTVITEILFARQGLGQLLHHAVLNQDYPVVQGVVVVSALTYSLVGMGNDLLHGVLDPRIRIEVEW